MASLSQRMKLFGGLLTTRRAMTGPLYVDVAMTNRCNLHCLGCPFHSPHMAPGLLGNKGGAGDIPLPMFRRLCDELSGMGTRQLVLQGAGEPLLVRGLEDMIAHAKQRGFHITVLSNGTLIDAAKARSLAEAGLDAIKVSLWAASPEQYELNYPGSKGETFHSVIDGLREMVAARRGRRAPKVGVYHVITGNNCEQLETMVELARTIGLDGLYFAPLYSPRGAVADFQLDREQQQWVFGWLREVRPRLRALGMSENIRQCLFRWRVPEPLHNYMPCYVAWFHARISHNGLVESCTRCGGKKPFGDLNEASFPEIWNGPAVQAFRRQTMTREGLAKLEDRCDCSMCCYSYDIHLVHRYFRWFRRLALATRKTPMEVAT
jgi:MoaA/NifB/PqqE/SkfB family radical SAM enzyme